MSKKHNFGAGPGILPDQVFEQASKAVLDFNGIGLSLLEISHRSSHFVAVMDKAVALVRELFNVSDEYEVLFLQGGASMQFCMVPYNLLDSDKKAAYLNTGTWANNAVKEARLFGEVVEVGSSKDKNYNYIPKGYSIPSDCEYFHITSNNTIFGTQVQEFPKSSIPVVCDMSSDIFSRPINVNDFGIIYAGAQKNMGPAGTTLVIVRKDLLGKVKRQIPTMLNYQTHIDKGSMFNTPPVFPIYASMLTLEWVKEIGGVVEVQKRNARKAELLYAEIDSNPLFKGAAAREDRSKMNVTFVLEDDSLSAEFLKMAEAAGCIGLKGHRSVGGFRASMYNALTQDSVKVLVDLMKEFALQKA
ncbi:MAG: phosphoserine aminotransferase [Sphingobacteriales bacterium]|jgi:phosphoserine aminotransferase